MGRITVHMLISDIGQDADTYAEHIEVVRKSCPILHRDGLMYVVVSVWMFKTLCLDIRM